VFRLFVCPGRQPASDFRCVITLQVAIFLCAAATEARAEAWLQPEGHGQLISSLVYYRSDTYVDPHGERFDQNAFSKTELNPYGEYGLSKNTTVGFNAFLQDFSQSPEDALPTVPTLRMGDTAGFELELFSRHLLYRQDGFILSAEPLVKLPTLYMGKDGGGSETTPFDVQLGIFGGYSKNCFGHDNFSELGVAYRHRFGSPADQLRLDLTLGTHLTDDWTALLAVNGILGVGASSTPAFTALGEDDIDLGKVSASLVYDLTDSVAVSAGGFYHFYARNTGEGGGAIVALWWTF
jgi:hypothetical protein